MSDLGKSFVLKWQSIRSPVPMLGCVSVYLIAIYFVVPRFMKKRQAYSLIEFVRCYNIFQVIVNFWLAFNTAMSVGPWSVFWRYCDTVYNNCGRDTERQLDLVWWALWLRVFDFIETVVFLLRKKEHQVSFLHVYHHITTAVVLWIFLKYFFHGFILFMVMMNCAMHAIMYLYYFLSTYGPKVQRKLRIFKKWLTITQMTQILLITLPALQGLSLDCNDRVKHFSAILLFNGLVNFFLFCKFYQDSYRSKRK